MPTKYTDETQVIHKNIQTKDVLGGEVMPAVTGSNVNRFGCGLETGGSISGETLTQNSHIETPIRTGIEQFEYVFVWQSCPLPHTTLTSV